MSCTFRSIEQVSRGTRGGGVYLPGPVLALVKSVSVGLWALVTLGDMAAVLHIVWHSAREGDDGEGGTHKVLGWCCSNGQWFGNRHLSP